MLSGQAPLEIFGSGEQTRTLTFVDDIADGIVTALRHPAALNEDFNISAAEELTVAEIARASGRPAAGRPRSSSSSTCRRYPVDVQRRWPSVEKARRLLGWEAQVDLADGVARTAEWLRTILV